MADFDTVSKHFIQKYPLDFIRLALHRDDFQFVGVIDTEQPTLTAHHADSLIRVCVEGREALVHHEFQTNDSDPPMPLRMAGYIIRAIEQHRLPVHSTVIYLRPGAGQKDPGYYRQDQYGTLVVVKYQVIRLIELDGQRILDEGRSGWIPFAPLMKPPPGMHPDAWLLQCANRAKAMPMGDAAKANYLANLAVLSGLVYNSETIRNIVSEAIMHESSIVQYLTEKALKQGIEEGIAQGVEQGIAQGMAQGVEQGIEQGIAQGIRERTVEALLDVLEIRFGLAGSDPLAAQLRAINDVQHLKQLHRAAIQTPTLDEFRRLSDTTR